MSATRLRLRVHPGARTSAVVGRHGEAWRVRVTAPPDRGRATEAVLTLLADTLGLARGDLTLISGAGSRDKIVEVVGIPPEEAERRLASAGSQAVEPSSRAGGSGLARDVYRPETFQQGEETG